MTDSRLYSLLNEFVSSETHTEKGLSGEEANVLSFKDIAQEIIFGGAFKVAYKYSEGCQRVRFIRIVDVEGYYFDDKNNNGMRDWSMYHRNRWTKDSVDPISPAYLPVGTFYLHNTGIDLTFESNVNEFRASFLLRSFQIKDFEDANMLPDANDISWAGTPVENRPSYLYHYMFSIVNPFDTTSNITWVQYDNKPDESPASTYRQNLAMFDTKKYHKGEPTKMNKSLYGELFEDGKHIITQDGKSIQDLMMWRFYDPEIKKYLKLRKE